jgi:hypothetical protein
VGYQRATYRLFKDNVSETEKDSKALVKLHMTMCVQHYHALIPQLDFIATQWGVDIEDILFYNNVGTPQKLASDKKTRAWDIRPDVGAAKTAEEGSQRQPEPGPSESCGGHAEVEAQTGATSQGLATDKPRIGNESKKEGQV